LKYETVWVENLTHPLCDLQMMFAHNSIFLELFFSKVLSWYVCWKGQKKAIVLRK